MNNTREPLVEAKGIHKSFGKLEVLCGIDLTIARGEVVALIGPSGSGKSTFLRSLNILERIDRGSIAISGSYLVRDVDGKAQYVSEAELKRLRRKMGMVFQSFNLFPHLSVLENLTLSPIHAGQGKARSAAAGHGTFGEGRFVRQSSQLSL